jgi:hypothetical protein
MRVRIPPVATTTDLGTRARLDAAFAREERRGLIIAAAARSVAVLVILVWLAYANLERGLAFAWVIGCGALFLVTGCAQLYLYSRNLAPAIAPYVFIDRGVGVMNRQAR